VICIHLHDEYRWGLRLAELLNEVAPGEILDKDVEEFLQQHIDEFVDSVTEYACQLAKHRKSRTLEARDIQLYLEKNWNIRVPGYGDDPRPARKLGSSSAQSAHAVRLQAIAKSQQNNS
jgi:transcription initiation factor TFIID subunit 12